MKRNILLAISFVLSLSVYAQQEPQMTQYMYNKFQFNPAYAGSLDGPCITGLYRHQWFGIDGAPVSQYLSFHTPLLNKRIGLGANLWHNTIGLSEMYNLDIGYAYRIPVSRGHLGIGLSASARHFRQLYSDARPTQQGDAAIPVGQQSKYVPNFGVGLYFSSQKFYVGASAPRLLQNNIDFADDGVVLSKEVRHLYLMGGVLFDLSENVKLQTQVLLKYVNRAPWDADANLSLIMLDKYTFGVSWRIGGDLDSNIGESVDLMLGAQVSDNIFLGVAYDVPLSDIRVHTSGSAEGVVRYCFGSSEGDEYQNPRFF